LETDELPTDRARARKVATQQCLFVILDGILYYLDKHFNRMRVAVPHHLKDKILMAEHRGVTGGHFSGKRTYSPLAYRWWWEGMYSDAIKYADNCPNAQLLQAWDDIISHLFIRFQSVVLSKLLVLI